MEKHAKAKAKAKAKSEVQVFAGIDVSARALSVGMGCGVEEPIAVTSWVNNAAGHKALLAYLLRGNARVPVCLEASGNYSLDLALALQAHPRVEISVVNPRRARRFANPWGSVAKPTRSTRVCFANMPSVCRGFLGYRPTWQLCSCVVLHEPSKI